MEAAQVRRQYIFAFAGPWIGFVVFCVMEREGGLLIVGPFFGWPFVYLFGLPIAVVTYRADQALIKRLVPFHARTLGCLFVGGLLSTVAFQLWPLPFGLHDPGLFLGSLPGAAAGFLCSCWGGRSEHQYPAPRH